MILMRYFQICFWIYAVHCAKGPATSWKYVTVFPNCFDIANLLCTASKALPHPENKDMLFPKNFDIANLLCALCQMLCHTLQIKEIHYFQNIFDSVDFFSNWTRTLIFNRIITIICSLHTSHKLQCYVTWMRTIGSL